MHHSKTYTASLADNDELEQEPETVSRSLSKTGSAALGTGAPTVAPPNTLDEEFALYEENGFVSAAIHQYADDVVMPGVRVVADSDETERWLEEDFLTQAGIAGGQRHQHFGQVIYNDVIQFLAYGNLLDENVKDSEGRITGFLAINPASCKASTIPNKPILYSPDDAEDDDFEGEETPRGEAAAFLQYHPRSPLGKKGRFDDKEVVALSLNDVTFRPRAPPAGKIWGTPVTRNISNELTEFINIRQDLARAIRTKAWGIWSVGFSTEVIETADEVLVDGWSPDEMDEFVESVGDLDPGQIVGHDGTIEFDKHEGEVPSEVLDVLEAYVKLIVSALPPPLYAIGFEDNINQFVVKEQEEIYEASVRSMQATLEETWTPTLRQVCEDHDKDPSGVKLQLEPAEDESPVRSMELDDLEKFALLSSGLRDLFGRDAFRAFKPEAFADLIAQLPEDAFKSEAFAGVPGGVPQDIPELSVLQEIEEDGNISPTRVRALRERLRERRQPREDPTSNDVSPWDEVIGAGDGLFNQDEQDENGGAFQREERSHDGTFQGSSSS